MNPSNHLIIRHTQTTRGYRAEVPVETVKKIVARAIAYSVHEQLEKQVKFNRTSQEVSLEVAVIPVEDYYEMLRNQK